MKGGSYPDEAGPNRRQRRTLQVCAPSGLRRDDHLDARHAADARRAVGAHPGGTRGVSLHRPHRA